MCYLVSVKLYYDDDNDRPTNKQTKTHLLDVRCIVQMIETSLKTNNFKTIIYFSNANNENFQQIVLCHMCVNIIFHNYSQITAVKKFKKVKLGNHWRSVYNLCMELQAGRYPTKDVAERHEKFNLIKIQTSEGNKSLSIRFQQTLDIRLKTIRLKLIGLLR